ncbi:MAG: type II secretory protein PulM [Halioglobus sp.]|nr:type II secretory protein PulM [Halioglobus sp.]
MKEWFAQLQQREQLSLLALAIALGLYLLYMLVWTPLDSRRDDLALQNNAIAASLTRVDAMVSEFLQLRQSGARPGGARRNLTSLINQSTRAAQLPVSRLQPNSRGEIQVRMENAAFDDVLGWLYQMEYREGLLVREVSITETGTAGRVNATVRIAQAG